MKDTEVYCLENGDRNIPAYYTLFVITFSWVLARYVQLVLPESCPGHAAQALPQHM